MGFTNFEIVKKEFDYDEMRIDKAKGHITGHVTVYRFRDKDTQQFVVYAPTFDITGYGDTYEKASEMLLFSLDEILESLFKLSGKQLDEAFRNLGWKHGLWNKRFSCPVIDITPQLNNLNADAGSVERFTLRAA